MSEGVITPRKKESVEAVVPYVLGKVCNWDTVDDSVQSRKKDRRNAEHRKEKCQALSLICPAFVETLRETIFLSQDHSSGVSGPPLKILH